MEAELYEILKGHSRSFYLTLCFLPKRTRASLSLAYLIARILDTITDQNQNGEYGGALLAEFRTALEKGSSALPASINLVHLSSDELRLVQAWPQCMRLLNQLDARSQSLLRRTLLILLSAMDNDVRRFPPGTLRSIESKEALDQYTYAIAGCVGELWVDLHALHYPAEWARIDIPVVRGQAVRFGKGLQLVNILRDFSEDLERGRIYWPDPHRRDASSWSEELKAGGPAFISVRAVLIADARAHLDDAARFLRTLPAYPRTLFVATSLPYTIARETLNLIERAPPAALLSDLKIKTSRLFVYRSLMVALVSTLFRIR